MRNNSIDLSKLKDEINDRKKSTGNVSNETDNNVKDKFLNGLIESLNTGKETESSNLLKRVDSETSKKTGDNLVKNNANNGEINKPNTNNKSQSKTSLQSTNVDYGDRDEKLFEEYERKKRQFFNNRKVNENQISSKPNNYVNQENQYISEDKLHETINNIISDKFAMIVEQAMKDSIIEIYTTTRMKEVLDDNKDTIRKIVIDVIRELQTKKKK